MGGSPPSKDELAVVSAYVWAIGQQGKSKAAASLRATSAEAMNQHA
jgi:hypothetical protein